MVAEGPVATLEELLRHLRRGPFLARVDEVEVSWSEVAGSYDSFGVDF